MSTPQPPYGDQPADPSYPTGAQPPHPAYGQQPASYGYPAQAGYPTGPGYPPQPGYPSPYGQQPAPKRRPSAWWFLPGVISLVLAVVAVVITVVGVAGMLHTDGYVPVDGKPHRVALEKTGKRMLFLDDGSATPKCTVADANGRLALKTVETDTETVDLDNGSWRPFAEFTAGSTNVTVACSAAPGTVRVGAPMGESEFLRVGVSVIAAIALGLLGLVILVVVGILFFTRKPRSSTSSY